jgi:Trypsin-like peptidase domain
MKLLPRILLAAGLALPVLAQSNVRTGAAPDLTLPEIAVAYGGSVGHVACRQGVEFHGAGTAFLIEPDIVATNVHVAAAGRIASIAFPCGGRAVAIEVLRQSDSLDWVELRVSWEKPLSASVRPIPFGPPSLRQGDGVVVIGNPLGLKGTMSAGIVSALRLDGSEPRIQVSAEMSPGSSGSPVLNMKGQLVGMAVSVVTGPAAREFNFASPLPSAASVLPVPLEYGEWATSTVTRAEREFVRERVAELKADVVGRRIKRAAALAKAIESGIDLTKGSDPFEAAFAYIEGQQFADLQAQARLKELPRGYWHSDGNGTMRPFQRALCGDARGVLSESELIEARIALKGWFRIDPYNAEAGRLLLMLPFNKNLDIYPSGLLQDLLAHEQVLRGDPEDMTGLLDYTRLRKDSDVLGQLDLKLTMGEWPPRSAAPEQRAEFVSRSLDESFEVQARLHAYNQETLQLLEDAADRDSRWKNHPSWHTAVAASLLSQAVRENWIAEMFGRQEDPITVGDRVLLERALTASQRAYEIEATQAAASKRKEPSFADWQSPTILAHLGRLDEAVTWYQVACERLREGAAPKTAVAIRADACRFCLEHDLLREADLHLVYLEELEAKLAKDGNRWPAEEARKQMGDLRLRLERKQRRR